MSARAEFPEGSHEVLAALLREVKTKAEFQRVQAVWLRVTLELPDEQIAQAVGLSANTVPVSYTHLDVYKRQVLE